LSSSRAGWPAGYHRLVLEEVDSTNAEAARRAAELPAPTWLLGLRQTAGRGRRGRAWRDPAGNFAATLLMRPEGGPQRSALRSFAAALALHDALAEATRRTEALSLKWPNDVLVNGAKVAGILLETAGQGATAGPLCIGIGVNLVDAPEPDALDATAMPATSVLSATGIALAPEAFLDILAPAFAVWEARLGEQGFAPLRAAFLDRAAHRGGPVTARTSRETLTGVFADIDATGALVIDTPAGGRRAVPAADIFF